MHNDFVIVGPVKDPARISKLKTAIEAFEEIADKGFPCFLPCTGHNVQHTGRKAGLVQNCGQPEDGKRGGG